MNAYNIKVLNFFKKNLFKVMGRLKGITKNRSGQFSLGLGEREKIDKSFTEKMLELSVNIILQMSRGWKV